MEKCKTCKHFQQNGCLGCEQMFITSPNKLGCVCRNCRCGELFDDSDYPNYEPINMLNE